jgi:hypothetical protein
MIRVEIIEDGEVKLFTIDRVRAELGNGGVELITDPEGDCIEWSELDETFRPGRWWRVVASDGSLWSETSSEKEARGSMRPGDKLYRGWVTTLQEWRPAEEVA